MNLILSFRSAAARPVWGAASGGNEAPSAQERWGAATRQAGVRGGRA